MTDTPGGLTAEEWRSPAWDKLDAARNVNAMYEAFEHIGRLKAGRDKLREALAATTKAENSNARRMRDAIVSARRHLAKGRALWNGPSIQCDAVLERALRAGNDADAIARIVLEEPKP